MNYTDYWLTLAEKDGYQAAFTALLERFAQDNRFLDDCRASRFYRFGQKSPQLPPAMVPVTEQQVSDAFDMADCHDELPAYFWLDDAGAFHPVTATNPGANVTEAGLDEHYSDNPCSVFSWHGHLLANDQVVGTVTYTDH